MRNSVLIIEDNEQDREYFKRLLGKVEDFDTLELYEADSEAQALTLYEKAQPGCIILDYHLPDSDGLTLLKKIKKLAGEDNLCVIMITGQSSISVAVEALKNGATDYLVKGEITKELFQKTLANAMEKNQMRQQISQQHEEMTLMNKKLSQALEEVQKREQALKEQAEELIRVNEDLDTFVYTASHDLKSPLNSLSSLINIFESQLSQESKSASGRVLELMYKSVQKLTQVIDDLGRIAKTQQEAHAAKEEVLIREVLDDLEEDLRPLISQHQAQLLCNLKAKTIYLARKNVRSILYNLISNAIKYRHPDRNPQVEVTTYEEDNKSVIIVQDNGLGLSDRHLDKLFTVFKRFHPHVEGSGVGLYMIKRLIENSKGQIKVESRQDEGTTFTIYLPLH